MPAKSTRGVVVEDVIPGGAAERAGLKKGDVVLSVGGNQVGDVLDYMFYGGGSGGDLMVSRKDRVHKVELAPGKDETPGLLLKQFKVKTCKNKCIFCFVSQLPRGLRKTLYLRDEDYRMSFLYGNYMTLSNLSSEDKRRIVRQRLSPLYISVHSTDRALRNRMLGNPRAPDVMKELRFFRDNRIHMHAQIVLCPGYNDGEALKRTIRDLGSLYPQLESVAVVPVGLTAHGKSGLSPVGREDALQALQAVDVFQKRFRKKHGDPVVYASDEIYIRAGRPFPPLKDYGERPQVENGVGMVAEFMARARRLRLSKPSLALRYLTFTGVSFHPYMKKFMDRLDGAGFRIKAVPVENAYFGNSITVTGLLTGRDVIRALSSETRGFDALLIPAVVLRDGGDVFLDDVRVAELERALGLKAIVVEPTPEALLERLSDT